MSYIRVINHFWDVQRMREDLAAIEISVYMHIVDFSNRQFWPEWAEVSPKRACFDLDLSEQRYGEARKRLIEAGLIEYEAGSRKKTPKYKLSVPKYAQSPELIKGLTPEPYSKERGEKKEREVETPKGEATTSSTATNLEKVISEVEAKNPKRSDVREIALILSENYGGKMTVSRLNKAVKAEKKKKYKSAEVAIAAPSIPSPPDAWESIYAEEFGVMPQFSWAELYAKNPEHAELVREIYTEENSGAFSELLEVQTAG